MKSMQAYILQYDLHKVKLVTISTIMYHWYWKMGSTEVSWRGPTYLSLKPKPNAKLDSNPNLREGWVECCLETYPTIWKT